MASALPVHSCLFKSNPSLPLKLLPPPPSPLFLLLILLLSLLLALSLLHLHDLILSHSLSPSFLLLSPLLPDKQSLLSHLLHVHQHYVAFVLSPCSIFIFANLIVFTLLLKSFYCQSASATDLLDFVLEDCAEVDGAASLQNLQQLLPRHGDLCLSQYSIPEEEHHILSFSADYDEDTYTYTNMQAGYSSHGARQATEMQRLDDAKVAGGKVRSAPTLVPSPALLTSLHEEPKTVMKTRDMQESRSDQQKAINRPFSVTVASPSPTTQSIINNTEVAPTKRSRNIPPASLSLPATSGGPSLARPPPVKASLPPSLSTSALSHRPPSSPRVKKSTQSSGKDGIRHEASNPIQLDADKEPSRVNKLVEKKMAMVRSQSDQRLSQRSSPRAEDVSTVITSPSSLINKSHLQRAQSARSSCSEITIADTSSSTTNKHHIQRSHSLKRSSAVDTTITDTTTNIPSSPASKFHIQRAQSLREHSSSQVPHRGQVRRSPSLSESLHGLSDDEANKCFSDFIAHGFAMMNKELD